MKKRQESAGPTSDEEFRDECAMRAMQAEVSTINSVQMSNMVEMAATSENTTVPKMIASNSYLLADAMLAERKKRSK